MVRHVGLMCVRNEIDVLPQSLAQHASYFDEIVAQDGSTDGGTDLLRYCPQVVKLFLDSDVVSPGERFTDGHRNVALEWILQNYVQDAPPEDHVWVTLLHADEFWYKEHPRAMAEIADHEKATYVLWGEYRFFLHTSDRHRPISVVDDYIYTESITERIRWYCGPFFEVRQFCLTNHQVYVPGKDHCTLPVGPGKPRRWHHIPRYRHYPYRSPEQCRRAFQDKVIERYWQPDHAWLAKGDPYVGCPPKPCNSPLAEDTWNLARYLGRFEGHLPKPSQFLPTWWKG